MYFYSNSFLVLSESLSEVSKYHVEWYIPQKMETENSLQVVNWNFIPLLEKKIQKNFDIDPN